MKLLRRFVLACVVVAKVAVLAPDFGQHARPDGAGFYAAASDGDHPEKPVHVPEPQGALFAAEVKLTLSAAAALA